MNDKEYTYDIDKYTIGVDENGEDGIGMTVAKIENGEINFLGNCYGENARCIDLLIKENQELKEKLDKYENPEDMTLMMMWCTEKVKDENEKLTKQLEETNKMIEKLEPVRGSVLTDLTNKDMVLKNNALIELCKTLNNINNRINELIDEVNKLKGEK